MVKAKSILDNNWVTGYLWYKDKEQLIPYVVDERDKKTPVVQKTICRALDIKDRNGTPIYEGDIIQPSQRGQRKAAIRYNKEMFTWYFDYNIPENKSIVVRTRSLLQASLAPRYKVVGNIWDR